MAIEIIVTDGQYDDPTEWNGDNPECKLCPKSVEMNDEYCEDHQRCYFCGENDDCDCEEEMKLVSACCGSRIDNDYKLCYECKDHATNAWDAHIEDMNVKHAVQVVRDLPQNNPEFNEAVKEELEGRKEMDRQDIKKEEAENLKSKQNNK